jgi:hypothetical protein
LVLFWRTFKISWQFSPEVFIGVEYSTLSQIN